MRCGDAAGVDVLLVGHAAAEPPAEPLGGAAAPVDGAALGTRPRARFAARGSGVASAAFESPSGRRVARGARIVCRPPSTYHETKRAHQGRSAIASDSRPWGRGVQKDVGSAQIRNRRTLRCSRDAGTRGWSHTILDDPVPAFWPGPGLRLPVKSPPLKHQFTEHQFPPLFIALVHMQPGCR